MAYNTIATMAVDADLRQRFVACAAQELATGNDPNVWVSNNIWQLVSAPGLAADYQFAADSLTINDQPRIGQRDDVINDAAILAVVAARIAELATP